MTVNVGGSLTLDNGAFLDTAAAVVPDRLRNAAAITLAGGGLEFRGNANAAAAEVVGTITASSNFTSTVASVSLGRPTTLTANLLTRNAAGFVSFRGYGADLGSANNRLLFYTPLTPQLSNGALPFATLAKAGDIDFAGYDPVRGVLAAPARTTLVGATAADNVKLTAGQTLGAATAVNALLLVGSNVTVGGTASLLVGSGLLVGDGPGNKVTAPVSFGGAVGLIDVATLARPGAGPSTLDLTGIVDGQAGVNKLGAGRAAFSAANTYAGVTTAAEGVLGVANSGALGAAGDGAAAQGTTVLAGAALELDGSGGNLAVANEALTLSGLGFGYGNTNALVSGNTGALRSLAGTNAWTGPVTLTNAGNNSLVVLGVDAGTLAINAAVGQSANVNVTKAGAGVLEFGGTAANT